MHFSIQPASSLRLVVSLRRLDVWKVGHHRSNLPGSRGSGGVTHSVVVVFLTSVGFLSREAHRFTDLSIRI